MKKGKYFSFSKVLAVLICIGCLLTPTFSFAAGTSPTGTDTTPIGGMDSTTPIDDGSVVSGTIKLPDGEVAPRGGLNLTVQEVTSLKGYFGDVAFVTIPEGQNSAAYSIKGVCANYTIDYLTFKVFAENDIYHTENMAMFTKQQPMDKLYQFSLCYTLQSGPGIDTGEYLRQGYYQNNGMTPFMESASIIDVSKGNVSNANLTIIKGAMIEGEVSLANYETVPSDTNVNLTLSNGTDTYSTTALIEGGSNSAGYSFCVPKSRKNETYKLGFSTEDKSYLGGYYGNSGTVTSLADAKSIVAGDTPNSEINVSLEKLAMRQISGRIEIPSSVKGYAVSVSAYDYKTDEFVNEQFTYINPSTRFVDYSLSVPVNKAGGGYRISCIPCNDGNRGSVKVYYSKTGATIDKSKSARIDVSAADASNINIKLVEGKVVKWQLKLPDGRSYQYIFTVPANQKGMSYKVGYRLDETQKPVEEYKKVMFIGTKSMVTDIKSAASFKLDGSDKLPVMLQVQKQAMKQDDYSNSMQNAGVLSQSTSKAGKIDFDGDVDYFKFTAVKSGMYTFVSAGNTDLIGELFGSDGLLLNSSLSSGKAAKNFSFGYYLNANTTCYIRVRGNNTSAGSYSVTVKPVN